MAKLDYIRQMKLGVPCQCCDSELCKTRKLVDILLTKDEKAFEAFVAFLKVNGQAEFNQFFNVYCSLQYWSGTIQLPGIG